MTEGHSAAARRSHAGRADSISFEGTAILGWLPGVPVDQLLEAYIIINGFSWSSGWKPERSLGFVARTRRC